MIQIEGFAHPWTTVPGVKVVIYLTSQQTKTHEEHKIIYLFFGLFHTSDPSLSRDNSRVVELIVDDLITGLGPSFYTAKT